MTLAGIGVFGIKFGWRWTGDRTWKRNKGSHWDGENFRGLEFAARFDISRDGLVG